MIAPAVMIAAKVIISAGGGERAERLRPMAASSVGSSSVGSSQISNPLLYRGLWGLMLGLCGMACLCHTAGGIGA